MKIGYNYLGADDEPIKQALLPLCEKTREHKNLIFGYDPKRGRQIESLPCSASTVERLLPGLRSWIYEEIFLPFAMAKSSIDLFFCPSANLPYRQPCKTAVTVKDLNPLMFLDEQPRGLEAAFKYKVRLAAAKKANRIITFSNTSKNLICRLLGMKNEKIEVLPYPVQKDFVPVYSESKITEETKKQGLRSPYFIYCGGASTRENLIELLGLFYSFLHAKNDTLLAIEGLDEKKAAEIKKTDSSGRLVFLGKLAPKEKCLVLNGASAFLSTSLHETTCGEALQAMACGIPIIAYETAAFSQILSHSAVLIKRGDNVSFIKAMKDAKDHPNMRLQMRALGIQHSKLFTAEKFASKMSEVFGKILGERYLPDEK
ncbi:MAG: glycosyltransferase [Candidatus Margulisiibacteriota bacterium]